MDNFTQEPPQYMPPIPEKSGRNETKLLILGVVVLLVAVGVFAFLKLGKSPAKEEVKVEENAPAPGVEVERADISASSNTKTPEGFPSGIPLDGADVTESYKAVYTEQGVTQYTVSFKSLKTKAELWKMYTDFFKADGYTLNTSVSNESKGVAMGSKGKEELNVVIFPLSSTQNYVTLNYVVRQ